MCLDGSAMSALWTATRNKRVMMHALHAPVMPQHTERRDRQLIHVVLKATTLGPQGISAPFHTLLFHLYQTIT